MTKQDLQRYIKLSAELDGLTGQLERLDAQLKTPRSSVWSLTPRGGKSGDWTDIVIRFEQLEEQYKEKIRHALEARLQIEAAIDTISDPVGRALMRYRYIDGLAWEQICVKLSYNWSHTHRLHGKYLSYLAKMGHNGTL